MEHALKETFAKQKIDQNEMERLKESETSLNDSLKKMFALVENYPDLKASANFLSLQDELGTTENKVSFARQFYNDNVRSLNSAVKTFPGNVFAGFAKVSARDFYEVDDPTSRQAPKIQF